MLVIQSTIALPEPNKHLAYSITLNNAKEVALHERMSGTLDTVVSFAHPYVSWERDLNENTNGLLRQCFPKNTDFKLVNQKAVEVIVERLNNRPRKTLGFKSPSQILGEPTVIASA